MTRPVADQICRAACAKFMGCEVSQLRSIPVEKVLHDTLATIFYELPEDQVHHLANEYDNNEGQWWAKGFEHEGRKYGVSEYADGGGGSEPWIYYVVGTLPKGSLK